MQEIGASPNRGALVLTSRNDNFVSLILEATNMLCYLQKALREPSRMSDWESARNLGVNGGRSRKLRVNASAALAGAWWADLWENVHNPVLLMQPRTE